MINMQHRAQHTFLHRSTKSYGLVQKKIVFFIRSTNTDIMCVHQKLNSGCSTLNATIPTDVIFSIIHCME